MPEKLLTCGGVVIAVMVILFATDAKAFSNSRFIKFERVNKPGLLFRVPISRLPTKEENNSRNYFFKATPTCSNQSYTHHVQFNRAVACLFKLFEDRSDFPVFSIVNPSWGNTFLTTLIRVIISPNAP